ncbi:hypothetical protein NE237_032239 [Protea cynaroides]|uniref:Uncharacterized protein n=1 Tax=Protea cynaroides TaxID=273540 RepID=A0A9Q0R398_9MAGN|nr:hypothetical protein NE237_032239 [Protea cynaroides]
MGVMTVIPASSISRPILKIGVIPASSISQSILKMGVIPLCLSSFTAVLPPSEISCLQNRRVGQATVAHCRGTDPSASPERERRSAQYDPSIWDHQLIESMKNPYINELSLARLEELKQEVKGLIRSTSDPLSRLELIDEIQRLGVAYHFEEEIKEYLDHLVHWEGNGDLYTAALKFRLLREHDYQISSDMFNEFKNGWSFRNCSSMEAKGLLSLYEASHLGMNGEAVLEEAMEFSFSRLKSLITHLGHGMRDQVQQSLEVPLHWRTIRLEARNFIKIYENDHTKSSILLELAKLDFNIVQTVHQRDLQELSRWWTDLDFKEEFCFARDRLVENFIWAVGIISEPQFSQCRKGLTKLICILTVIDDIYDVYGSLDELELLTNAVDRWDLKAVEELPNYMKSCYLALLNFGNGVVFDAQTDHGLNILPYVKKEWANLCKAYLVEARWFYEGYTPGLDEYLANAWISVGGPVAIAHGYLLRMQDRRTISDESFDDWLNHGLELFYWASIITRLSDDLGTSQAEMARGDVHKSIQCYMMENGISEGEAREHIKGLVGESWKKLNECCQSCGLPRWAVDMALNMARTALCIFQHGDGIGSPSGVTEDRVVSLFIEPLP